MKDEASRSGLAVIGRNSDDREAEQTRYPELLEEYRVQRILIMPVAAAGGRPRRGTQLARVDGSLPGEAAR